MMTTKAIAVTTVFAALTLVLTRIFVPAPYFPLLYYEIWEIPIVSVFFFLSPKYGFLTLLINTAVAFIFFPAFSTPGLNPLYSLVACSSMLSGMLIANRFFSALSKKENQRNVERKMLGLSTVLGIVLRVLLMTMFVYVNFVWILGTPASVIIAGLPFIAVFNITLPLYTIPLGFLLGKTINRTLKTNIQL
jgi:riboflavin transporter FmnP